LQEWLAEAEGNLSKLKYPDINSGNLKELFDGIQQSRGWISNALRMLAHAPQGLKKFHAVGHYSRYDTDLSVIQRELIIVITGRGIPYAAGHHVPLARDAGVTEEQIKSIIAGEVPSGLAAKDAALCAYVFAFTSFKGVDEKIFQNLQRYFSPRQITDISLVSAYYLALGACIIAFDVELEPPEMLQTELDWQRKQSAAKAP
jgi:4-carboxymuconolactone decarboxylase